MLKSWRTGHFPEDIVRQGPLPQVGVPGDDIQLSSAAKCRIPYAFECKNQERVNIWEAVDQAKRRKKADDGTEAVVVIKKNGQEPHVLMPLRAFLKLISAPEVVPSFTSKKLKNKNKCRKYKGFAIQD